MKTIIQSEAAECGLAALAMVASAHGRQVSLVELRRRFRVPSSGSARLAQLIEVAEQLQLSAQYRQLQLRALGGLSLPCVLQWDMDHCVVLSRIHAGKATILDPAQGKRTLPLAQLGDHFSGIAVEVLPAAGFTPGTPVPAVGILLLSAGMQGLWSVLLQLLLLSVLLQGLLVLVPLLLQWLVDQSLLSAGRDLLTMLGLGLLLLVVMQVGVGGARGWVLEHLAVRMDRQRISNVLAHVLRLPLDYFERRSPADVGARLSSLQAIQHRLGRPFLEAVIDAAMVTVTLVLMWMYSGKLALVSLCAAMLHALIQAAAWRPLSQRMKQQQVAQSCQQQHLLESVRGIYGLKVAGREAQRRRMHEELLDESASAELLLARLQVGLAGLRQLVAGIEYVAVLWIGALLVIAGVFSLGMLIAYLAFMHQFSTRMRALVDYMVGFGLLRLRAGCLADVVLATTEVPAIRDGSCIPGEMRIQVEGLSFRYGDDQPWVLKDCSFSIEPGQAVAIVGASGAGKTTLLKLLLGLLPPTNGSIRIGGHELQRVGPRNLRTLAGVVMQDDRLFAGSIADNISLFDAVPDPARLQAAARLAALHEDIAAVPTGYDARIEELGRALSGCQRQRLLLARALYRQPRLLLLDGVTERMDAGSEKRFAETFRQLRFTRLLLARHMESAAGAERIFLLGPGGGIQELRQYPGDAAPPA